MDEQPDYIPLGEVLSIELSKKWNTEYGVAFESWKSTAYPEMRERARSMLERVLRFEFKEFAKEHPEYGPMHLDSVEWSDDDSFRVAVSLEVPKFVVRKEGSYDSLILVRNNAPWNF